MSRLIAGALVSSLLLAAAVPAVAQNYQRDNDRYLQDRAEYDRQMQVYNDNQARYQRDRDDYNRRYGAGAFERYYGDFRDQAPVYNGPPDRFANNNRPDRPDRYDPYQRYYNSTCERRTTGGDRAGGTVLGALIGGALGAAAAGDNSEGEGAILGAIVGGALGNSIAANQSSYDRYAPQCDVNGYYYTYDQTTPYRENSRYRNGRYDTNYYSRQRCRLAVAPDDRRGRMEYRYVRVCPDRSNRYRITS